MSGNYATVHSRVRRCIGVGRAANIQLSHVSRRQEKEKARWLKREGIGLRYMSFLEAMLQRQALRGFGKFW